MPEPVAPHIAQFLREHIGSIAQLEMLLTLHGQPERSWSAEEVAKQLYLGASMAEPLLEKMRTAGLLVLHENHGRSYQYAPKTPEIDAVVTEVKRTYLERPVSTVNVIYALPDEKLQNFADAFRIRRKEDQ